MDLREKAIIIASDHIAFSAHYNLGAWSLIQFPDVCCISPTYISTVDAYSGTDLLFLRNGDIILANGEEFVLEYFDKKSISPFRVRTDCGDFLISPPTDVTNWIVTKITRGGKSVLLEAGDWIEGIELLMQGKNLTLIGKKEETLFSAQIEMIF